MRRCGAARDRPADHLVGRAAARGGQAAVRRAGGGRRLSGRRAVHRAVAGAGCSPAGSAVDPDRHAAAAAVSEAPLPAGLPEPVPGGRRLELVAAVLPHRSGPAGAASDHAGQAGGSRRSGHRRATQHCPARQAAAAKLLRAGKLRVDTTVVEADIDHPTDADLLEGAVRKLGGLVRRVEARGVASRTRFRDRGRAAGRRLKQISRSLRRRTEQAPAEVDRLTAQVAGIARRISARPSGWPATPAGRLASGPQTGGSGGWSTGWSRPPARPGGCWIRPASGLPGSG